VLPATCRPIFFDPEAEAEKRRQREEALKKVTDDVNSNDDISAGQQMLSLVSSCVVHSICYTGILGRC
jgi:hypothetical protein